MTVCDYWVFKDKSIPTFTVKGKINRQKCRTNSLERNGTPVFI